MCVVLHKKVSVYEEWVFDTTRSVHDTWKNMRELDKQEMFEKDDEVGLIFNELKSLLDNLNEKVGEDIYAKEENDDENSY